MDAEFWRAQNPKKEEEEEEEERRQQQQDEERREGGKRERERERGGKGYTVKGLRESFALRCQSRMEPTLRSINIDCDQFLSRKMNRRKKRQRKRWIVTHSLHESV